MTGEVTATSLALRRVPDFRLKTYFATELLADVILEAFQLFHLPGYVSVYLAIRPLNFLTALWAVPITAPAAITAIFLTYSDYLWIGPDFSLLGLPALIQGGLYTITGVSAVKKYPILAATWLVLGLFNFGFAAGWHLPTWAALNQWWCALVAVVGFIAFALSFRPLRPR